VHVFLNGEIVPEDCARVPVSDRGILYGDALFEAILVARGKPFRWPQHLLRLRKGAAFLGIRVPATDAELAAALGELLRVDGLSDAIARITLTRGSGPRGYSPKGADLPTLFITCHPLPAPPSADLDHWKLVTASFRVAAGDPMANLKTANKLLNVLARAEAEARGANEALLVNTDGHVAEAAAANVFWIDQGTVCTSPLDEGALEGVTRGLLLEICRGLGVATDFRRVPPSALLTAEGVFLTLSTLGLVEAVELDGQSLRRSDLTRRLAESIQLQILAEC
jgi:branched-chain amino acid aminotransferase